VRRQCIATTRDDQTVGGGGGGRGSSAEACRHGGRVRRQAQADALPPAVGEQDHRARMMQQPTAGRRSTTPPPALRGSTAEKSAAPPRRRSKANVALEPPSDQRGHPPNTSGLHHVSAQAVHTHVTHPFPADAGLGEQTFKLSRHYSKRQPPSGPPETGLIHSQDQRKEEAVDSYRCDPADWQRDDP